MNTIRRLCDVSAILAPSKNQRLTYLLTYIGWRTFKSTLDMLLLFCAVYKYSYLLLTYFDALVDGNPSWWWESRREAGTQARPGWFSARCRWCVFDLCERPLGSSSW